MVRVRFCHNREQQRIAYVDEGQGPLVVMPAWWVSNLERDVDDPGYVRFFARLAERFRVVRYDRIGVGVSDRARQAFTLASEVADLTALVDHLGVPRFHFFCLSCAGPVALAYTVQNPDRVDRIVLYGSYLHGPSLAPPETRDALVALVRANGRIGSRTLADIFCPLADADTRNHFVALHRSSAEPETAARLLELTFEHDARPFVGRVPHPILVLHRKGDRTVLHDHARTLASALPNATLTTLPGSSHMPWHDDVDATVAAIGGFLSPQAARSNTESPNELRLEGEVWRLRFDGRQALLRECKGLEDLARLLEKPGNAIHVLDMLGANATERRDSNRGDVASDRRALDDYRRRLRDLDDGIADAEARSDRGATTRLSAERAALLHRLAADTGRGGRARRLNDPVERARKAVTARLRDAIRRIKSADREAGEHLERSIQTGVHCAYRPSHPVRWTVGPVRVA